MSCFVTEFLTNFNKGLAATSTFDFVFTQLVEKVVGEKALTIGTEQFECV